MFSRIVFTVALVAQAASQTDNTRQAGSQGSDVVESAIEILRDACLFSDTQLFLRRLAYVESQDGTDPGTYTLGNNGGIWQIDRQMLTATKTQVPATFENAVKQKLDIVWSSVQWADLRKPLYSGLAAIMYLQSKGALDNIPSEINAQAAYWRTNYRVNGDEATFINLARKLQAGCAKDQKMDILFLVDSSSSSLFSQNSVKGFIKNYIRSVDLGLDKIMISVASFGVDARIDIALGSYSNEQDFLKAVDGISLSRGLPNLTIALNLASSPNFHSCAVCRKDVAKVVFLMTGTSQTSLARHTIMKAIDLKNKGVLVYAVGTSANAEALRQITSLPSCVYSSVVQDSHSLGSLHTHIARTLCRVSVGLQVGDYNYPCGSNVLVRVESDSVGKRVKVSLDKGSASLYGSFGNSHPSKDVNDVAKTLTSGKSAIISIQNTSFLTLAVDSSQRHLPSCSGNFRIQVESADGQRSECQKRKPDIVLLLDASNLQSEDDFNKIIYFASNYISQFTVGPNAGRVSVVIYAGHPQSLFQLNTYNSAVNMQTALRTAKRLDSQSNLASALKFVREETFTNYNGLRRDSSKVLVVVTGHSPTNPALVHTQAKYLHNEGVRTVVVALGSAVTSSAIQNLASGVRHIQNLISFQDLQGAVNKAVEESCAEVKFLCVENGVNRVCRIEDLLASFFGASLVPGHGSIPNSPCSLQLPGVQSIKRFPHPRDRDKFLICDNRGQTYVVLCPAHEVYNPLTSMCVLSSSSASSTTQQHSAKTSTRTTSTQRTTSTTYTTTSFRTSTSAPHPSLNPCSEAERYKGHFLHPYTEPHYYIRCTGKNNTFAVEKCQQNRVWRQLSLKCELEFATGPSGQAVKTVHNPCATNHPGLFPHPFLKMSYIQCDAFGQGFIRTCLTGNVFDAVQRKCVTS